MTKGTRPWTLVIVLVLGFGVGSIIGHPRQASALQPQPTPQPATQSNPSAKPYPTPPGPYPKAQNWTLTVGPDACDVTSGGKKVPVAVIERGKHSIRYQSNAGQLLGIVFHAPPTKPDAPKPFRNMTFAGTDSDGLYKWALVCDQPNHGCLTGPALKGSAGGYYKTDQILEGKTCDAGIIIQP
ncbi:MAG TPA: hypothetical protein VJ776_06360 [Thermoanaerobaculia bacterium]|nr:hypothetical protein [Thermoanaerobaculia bacterium]